MGYYYGSVAIKREKRGKWI